MRLPLIFLTASLMGCSGGAPDHSAAICIDNFDEHYSIERDFIETYESLGFEVTEYKYGVGNLAQKFWGPKVGVSFELRSTSDPERPMLIVGWLRTNGDDEAILDFEKFFIEKWGGHPRSPNGYNSDLCDEGNAGQSYSLKQGAGR